MNIMKKATAIALCSATIFLGSIGATHGYFTYQAKDYIENNPSFSYVKVMDQVDYWGGDVRYVDRNENKILMKPSPLSTHFNVGNRPIQVGYSSNVSNEAKQQFDYTFNYLNKLFEVINPKYKFYTSYNSKNNCDIYIEFANLHNTFGALVLPKTDSINPSKITSAHIWVNDDYKNQNANLRFFLAHEMMHVLLGADDVNEYESKTFSVFNSADVGFICSRVNDAKIPTTPEQQNKPYYLTNEQKESFITLLPTDVSTLISVYGNPTKENSEKYLALLNYTYQKCKNFFGDQPYYEKDYSLPNKEDLGR